VLAKRRSTDSSARPLLPLEGAPVSLGSLRIAYIEQFGGAPVSAEVRAGLEAFVTSLRAAGVQVTRAEPPDFDYVRTWETWGAIVGAQGGYDRSNVARVFAEFFVGGKVEHLPMQRRILGPITVPGAMAALSDQDRQVDAMERFLSGYDAWIVPAASTTAFPHHAPSDTYGTFNVYDEPVLIDGAAVPYYVATQSYTTLFSVTGSPVVAMPVAQSAGGLPIAVQVVGRRFEDLRLLRVAALLDGVVERPPFPLQGERSAP
jgi:amidase